MNKFTAILFSLALSLLWNVSSVQAQSYGMAGCGLGSLIIKSPEGGMQIIAATTNATGIQTSGITSGTSNCTASGLVRREAEQEVFVHLNIEALEREIASGNGEKLATLAKMIGCSSSKEVGMVAKSKYQKLFPEAETKPSLFLTSLKQEILSNPHTKAVCLL